MNSVLRVRPSNVASNNVRIAADHAGVGAVRFSFRGQQCKTPTAPMRVRWKSPWQAI
jgi:hypothetical protein